MTELRYPSKSAPSLPGLSLTLGDGWEPVVSAGALLATVKVSETGGFAPNLQVTVTRHPSMWTLDDEAAALDSELSALDDVEAHELPSPDIAASPHLETTTRLAVYRHPDAGMLVQFFVIVRAPTENVADFVHLIGTIDRDGAEAELDELKAIAQSLRVLSSSEGSDDGAEER